MAVPAAAEAAPPLVFVSAFTAGEEGAIHAFELDTTRGTLLPTHREAAIENPFFIAVSPDQRFLYAIDTPTFGGSEPESVAAFRILDRSGRLEPLGQRSTRGTASCYLETDSEGKRLLVANYSSGSVASYRIDPDGSLSEPVSFVQHEGSSIDPTRQQQPHAHCFVFSPDGRFAYAADLGIDRILCYAVDPSTAELSPNRQPFVRTAPGSGPRHLAFHPDGQQLYVINELSNTLTSFVVIPETGMLIERDSVDTLPPDFADTSHTADVKVTPDGRFVYGTNRGHDSIAAFRIEAQGKLEPIEITASLGRGPQNLAITQDGRWLLCANMPGNNVAVFRITADGRLESAGDPIEMPSPSCIRILE